MDLEYVNDLRAKNAEIALTPLLIDNNAALKLGWSPKMHDRTKQHIDIKYHSLREMTLIGRINTQKVKDKDDLANVFANHC